MHPGRGLSIPWFAEREPMQAAVMDQFEKKMLAEVDRISPEAVMNTWLSLMPQGAEQLQKLFTSMFSQGFGGARE
jgi:hypothetical protein